MRGFAHLAPLAGRGRIVLSIRVRGALRESAADESPPPPNPLPAGGRGIAYGFEASIALEDKTDSEDDSRIMEGVGWASSRRFSGGWRTRAQTMRDTNCWRCCS